MRRVVYSTLFILAVATLPFWGPTPRSLSIGAPIVDQITLGIVGGLVDIASGLWSPFAYTVGHEEGLRNLKYNQFGRTIIYIFKVAPLIVILAFPRTISFFLMFWAGQPFVVSSLNETVLGRDVLEFLRAPSFKGFLLILLFLFLVKLLRKQRTQNGIRSKHEVSP